LQTRGERERREIEARRKAWEGKIRRERKVLIDGKRRRKRGIGGSEDVDEEGWIPKREFLEGREGV
jgi:hypothetical protein